MISKSNPTKMSKQLLISLPAIGVLLGPGPDFCQIKQISHCRYTVRRLVIAETVQFQYSCLSNKILYTIHGWVENFTVIK